MIYQDNNIIDSTITKKLLWFLISDIWNYIENLRCTAADLSQRVLKAQRNVEKIKFLINQWKDSPLFQRIEKERVESLLNLKGMSIINYLGLLKLQGRVIFI